MSSEVAEALAAAAEVGSGPANVSGSAMKGSAAVIAAFVARFTNIPFLKSSTLLRASGNRRLSSLSRATVTAQN